MITPNCHYCKNKKFDKNEGIICGLSNKKEYLTNGCNDYKYDGTNVPRVSLDEINNQSSSSSGVNKDVIIGALFLFGGLIITIVSMTSGNGGGVIAYGAMIGGFIQLLSGFSKMNK